jgi:adenylate kinase
MSWSDSTFAQDGFVSDLVIATLSEKQYEQGFVLDGYPRTIIQAKAFCVQFSRPCYIFSLKADESLLINRCLARSVCPECGRIYVEFDTPAITVGTCDDCGIGLVKRADDRLEIVERRIREEQAELEQITLLLETKFPVIFIECAGKLITTSNLILTRILDLQPLVTG